MLEHWLKHSDPVQTLQDRNRFSDRYLELREDYRIRPPRIHHLREPRGKYLKDKNESKTLTEKHFRAVWYENRYERRGLRLADGRKISVVLPGEWNTGEGPDFLNAEIRIEDGVIQGDVEIHLRASDWIKHGHQKDSKYNRVILHVVLFGENGKVSARTQEGKEIPQLELKDSLTDLDQLLESFDIENYPYKTAAFLGQCGKSLGLPSRIHPEKYEFIHLLLNTAGDGRILIKGKMQEFKDGNGKLKNFDELDSVIYSKILEGLGYSQNKIPMITLSKNVPYSLIKNVIKKTPVELGILRLEAIFFGASGLLPVLDNQYDEETKKYLSDLHAEWKKYGNGIKVMSKSEWVFKGIRPHNYPTRRLSGMSYYLSKNVDSGLFQSVLNQMNEWNNHGSGDARKSRQQIQKTLIQSGEGYFGVRAIFGGKKFLRKAALIGEERSLIVWVNTFLPLLAVWARENDQINAEENLHRLWIEISTKNQNRISKVMLGRILGSKADSIKINKEHLQQGLIQIFQDFCDTKLSGCTGCSFPRLMLLSSNDLLR